LASALIERRYKHILDVLLRTGNPPVEDKMPMEVIVDRAL
jgi:hypothetical protein